MTVAAVVATGVNHPAQSRAAADAAKGKVPLLLQTPAVSASQIAFSYAGDLWTVDRAGGDARRLTAGVGLESYPVFSPDGSLIAFAGEYEGNLDVYVVPTAGGVPRRLTHHPDPDVPVGWTRDGKEIIFRSPRSSYARFLRLFSVAVDGGPATELPLPMAEDGSFSPDGKHIAYVPYSNKPQFPGRYRPLKNYRGGSASPLWIADLSDSSIVKVERTTSNEFHPMWIGDTVYFLSDRDGATTIYACDPNTGKNVRRVLEPAEGSADIKSASACEDAIVFDQGGSIHLFDVKSHTAKAVPISVAADLPAVRPKMQKVAKTISAADLSPSGARAVFEARGEILTVPVEKGDARNLTHSPGTAERDPAWSPDGKSIAYFSDESGEYRLHIRAQNGQGKVQKLRIGDTESYFYNPSWSPDCKKIACSDKRSNVWIVDVASGKSTKIDSGYYGEGPTSAVAWSPDSQWVAFTRALKSYLSAVFLYSMKSGKVQQITDGMSDAQSPAFDKGGKYLFFLASTDIGPSVGSGMSIFNRPVTRAAYVVVLSKDDPSPLAPESDDEKDKKDADKKEADTEAAVDDSVAADKKDAKKDEKSKDKKDEKGKEKKDGDKKGAKKPATPKVKVDLENIDQRTLALPIPAKNYRGLAAGKAGSFILIEAPELIVADDGGGGGPGGPASTIHRFDLAKRKLEKLVDGVNQVAVSFDGEKMLYNHGPAWFVVGTAAPAKPGDGALKMDKLEVRVDPRAEWKQIYAEVLRIERDFLYDPNFHGYNLKKAWSEHAPYLEGLGSRHDLNYLLDELLSGLSLQHVYLAGGDVPQVEGPTCGLLGADYKVEQGRYRIAKIYRGESWNPSLRAPLTQPGANVKEGEYLLAINGQDLRGNEEVYAPFEATAGKQTILKVGPTPDGKGSREVTVVPVESERALRNLAWVDGNRRAVDKATGGKVAYIYLPNTSAEGYIRFNRYFFAQAGRDAVIVDERFNGGGLLADHVVDYLRQPIRNYATTREGADQSFPTSAIPGPKVMLINEMAGSGGDYLPYTFRQSGLGPLIGKRTWGGLVGIGGYPSLIDGGSVTAPRWGIWFPNGKWDVENRGVAPDIEVEFDPKAVRQGKDPQLDKAIEVVMGELAKHPVQHPKHPAFPNYYKPGMKDPAEGM
ncbi:MAG TPA: PDZ domain-containing protein [Planctomycetaceae bacterium]|nr:PDZ domain-containing protein [Planctomycetaceae bacterium]